MTVEPIAPLNHEVSTVRATVSHSEVESYLRCERQHFYGYGLEIMRDTESDSLLRGTLGHAALEAFFHALKEGTDFDEAMGLAIGTALGAMTTTPVLASEVVETLNWFFEGYPFKGWRILAVEQEFQMTVREQGRKLVMPFVIDLVAQDQEGLIWVIDHKFMYDFITDRDAELMPQLPKYVAGLRVLGYQVDRAAYSILRHRQLKENTVDKRYQFRPVHLSEARIKQTIIEQVQVSDRVQDFKEQPLGTWSRNAMRTANKMVCNNCSFRSLCVAELNDTNPNLVLQSEFVKKERREFKEIEQGT